MINKATLPSTSYEVWSQTYVRGKVDRRDAICDTLAEAQKERDAIYATRVIDDEKALVWIVVATTTRVVVEDETFSVKL